MNKDLLHELFDYKDGHLIWNGNIRNHKTEGKKAGYVDKVSGYTRVSINNKPYSLHRLIWIYHNEEIPEDLQVDHINRERGDNRIDNLRLVSIQENAFNRYIAKGYSWSKRNNKWRSMIRINGKQTHLGLFDTESDARQAYLNAKEKYHAIKVRHA